MLPEVSMRDYEGMTVHKCYLFCTDEGPYKYFGLQVNAKINDAYNVLTILSTIEYVIKPLHS